MIIGTDVFYTKGNLAVSLSLFSLTFLARDVELQGL